MDEKKSSIAMDGVAMDEFLPKVDQGYGFVPGQMRLGYKEVPMQESNEHHGNIADEGWDHNHEQPATEARSFLGSRAHIQDYMGLLEQMNEVLLNIMVCRTFREDHMVEAGPLAWFLWDILACNISRPFYRQDNARRGSSWQFRE